MSLEGEMEYHMISKGCNREPKIGSLSSKPIRSHANKDISGQTKQLGISNNFSRKPTRRNHTVQRFRERNDDRSYFRKPEDDVEEAYDYSERKGKNLNHLLNFKLSKHESVSSKPGITPKSGRRKPYVGRPSRLRKEQFLQANCQFVVKDGADYAVHSVDPDVMVDWEAIEQIRVYGSCVPSCPICLYPPVAAKITRCGHIYCWQCILHYLSLGENKWRKCPICYDSVCSKDLKSVVALETKKYAAGDKIKMRLMKRSRGSTYAMPASQWHDREGKPHYLTDDVPISFAKLVMANTDDVQAILNSERTALETQLADEGESLEGSYVKAALESLQERQVGLTLLKGAEEALAHSDCIRSNLKYHASDDPSTASLNSFASLAKPSVTRYTSAFDDEMVVDAGNTMSLCESLSRSRLNSENSSCSGVDSELSALKLACSPPPPAAMAASLPVNEVSSDSDPQPVEMLASATADVDKTARSTRDSQLRNSSFIFYYQAEDGQNIYLHSINARCLAFEYGSLEKSPDTIEATIVEVEEASMTEELRSRQKHLEHVPLSCEYKVVELSLKSPVISKKTLARFQDDIDKRRRHRQWRNKSEKRQLKHIDDKHKRKYEHDPVMMNYYSSQPTQPESASVIVRSEMPELVTGALGTSPELDFDVSPHECSVDSEAQPSAMSFAAMLRAGKTKPQTEVVRKLTDVGGAVGGDVGSDDEDGAAAPSFQSSFGDAMTRALDRLEKDGPTPVVEASSGGKKGKKKKKTLLFVTNMSRGK